MVWYQDVKLPTYQSSCCCVWRSGSKTAEAAFSQVPTPFIAPALSLPSPKRFSYKAESKHYCSVWTCSVLMMMGYANLAKASLVRSYVRNIMSL